MLGCPALKFAKIPSRVVPEGNKSTRWLRCLTFLEFFAPLLCFLLTRSILENRTLQRGQEFSLSAHFSMHPKQNRCSHPFTPARSS